MASISYGFKYHIDYQVTFETSTYIFQEHVYCFVLLGIDCSLEEGEENVFQHLGKVWYYLL